MNKFVFITHLTPKAKRSPLRESLIRIYSKALLNQKYDHWKVLQIGETERKDERFFELRVDPNLSKAERRKPLAELYDREDVKEYLKTTDYIVKLDDDDVISPDVLSKLADFNGDLYFDRMHSFYDVTSGQMTSQNRNWIASTCVHKTELVLSKHNLQEKENVFSNSILYTNHANVWHKFYEGKKCTIAEANHPVYLRILSPTSITSGIKKFPLSSFDEIDFDVYYKYLASFGNWKQLESSDFDEYLPDLKRAWEQFAGRPVKQLPAKLMKQSGILSKFKELFKR